MPGKKQNKKNLSLDDYKREYVKIGKQLKRLRIEAGYTAALDFAYEHDLPVAQYARYEAGSNMKLNSLITVLSKHGLTLDEFFRGFK